MNENELNHRGRIQAQGGGLEESESWAMSVPITVDEALELLESLKNKLSSKELKVREKEFDKARAFIVQAGENGGVDAQVSKTFKVKGTKDLRVDIEVIKGRAFVKNLILLDNEENDNNN
jgi:hypothetical protein